jgi:flagellar L-ring protein precursor FlgH
MPQLLTLITLLALLGGCATYEVVPPHPDDAAYAPPAALVNPPASPARDGGLFRPDYTLSLVQDRRAYRVGDILTVVLDERTQSSKKADTSFGKDSSISIGVPQVGNATFSGLQADVSGGRDFKGSSATTQQNALTGAITVMVTRVFANGALQVRGEKWIRLNQGDEYLRLNGFVRVDDIDAGNRISSQRIADARITYAGRGALADANQAGWLTRFFNSALAPF